MTLLVPASRLVICASREAMDRDSAASPRMAVCTYGGELRNVTAIVSRLLASSWVLIWLMSWPTPPNA